METSSVIVVASASQAEQLLLAGDIGCPDATRRSDRPHESGGAYRIRDSPIGPRVLNLVMDTDDGRGNRHQGVRRG